MTLLGYDPTAFDLALANVMRITVIVLAILFHLFLIRYVYQDAHDRGDPNKIPWALLALISNVLGVILYFYVTKDFPSRIRGLSALWLFNGFLLLIIGGLFFFGTGPSSVQLYAGYFFLIIFILPITLLIVGSGVCALWIGFQVVEGILTDQEIRTSLVFALLGLISFLVAIISLVTTEMHQNPFAGFIPYVCVWFIIIFYALGLRSKARSN
jgi:hypothetical protein